MREVNFLQSLHTSTKRDYLARMNPEKPHCCEVAKQWGKDYWDGDRKYGYGGYKYDGRWREIAKKLIEHYRLVKGETVIDIGCGKGHLMHELLNFGVITYGADISNYAIKNSPPGNKEFATEQNCTNLSYESSVADLVYSINLFHNLGYKDLKQAIREMVRVGKEKMYICVESYRNDQELMNLQCWALTCKSFYSPDDWKEILLDNGYDGDVEFIFFQ